MNRKWYAAPYGVWMVIFTVVPFLLIIYYSLTAGDGGFTLSNFQRFFDPVYIKVLGRSLGIAALCTVFCLLIGYPAALFMTDKKVDRRGMLILLFVIPMWMNFLLRTYAWLTLLESNGIVTKAVNAVITFFGGEEIRLLYNYNAVLMGMIYNFLPFMILPIHSVLTKIDRRVIEAAQDLGANPFTVFIKVILPLSVPGIVSGCVMVFMPAVTTFVISTLLGGGMKLFGDLIQQQMITTGDWNFGSALSMVMLILILISMFFMNKFDNGEGNIM
ncbi:MAG: ABC transporter permease [Clostridiales bacterium]|nr:ABC transporter permease [Clostridiales bacterium]MBQ2816620.1 ABC transporter permease [Clostridia bacterium]